MHSQLCHKYFLDWVLTPYPVPHPSTSAFGAYTGLTYSQSPIPASRSKKTWRKTIILVSLTRKEGVQVSKGSARVDYEVVTQVVVNLRPSACTVSAVTDLVRKQVVALTKRRSYAVDTLYIPQSILLMSAWCVPTLSTGHCTQ